MSDRADRQTTTRAAHHDPLLTAFRSAWEAGENPQIEHFVSAAGPTGYALFPDLLRIELSQRCRHGERPSTIEYLDRFPAQREAIGQTFSEFEFSTIHNVAPTLETGSYHATESPEFLLTSVPQRIAALGRYEVRNLIGSGGFGAVFRGYDRELRRDVAIKIPREGVLKRNQEVKRFMQEAVTAARLNHPNICRVYDLSQIDGTPYIVMSYIEGESLKAMLSRNKSIKPRQSVFAVYKLCGALAEAHRQGIVHRDLKPSNIMFDSKRRELLILDFGLARHVDAKGTRLTITGEVLGTPAYMSPEQVRGHVSKIGPASDVYSLGAILYEMLTGSLPFDGSVAEIFAKILYEEPVPPSMCRPDIGHRLDPIVLKALAKSSADRYESMEEFSRELARFLKTRDVTARNSPKPQRDELPAPADALSDSDSERETATAVDWDFPVSGPSAPEATCPSCQAAMSRNSLLCGSCGFHQGMNQRFDILARDYVPADENKANRNWLRSQLEDDESLGGFLLAIGGVTVLVTVVVSALLYRALGVWVVLVALGILGTTAAVIGKLLGKPIGPNSIYLTLRRLTRWRSLWHWGRVPNILDLRNDQVSDEDLMKLKPEWGLEILDLEGTMVTDVGLTSLGRLVTLRYVILRRTAVSTEGIRQLRDSFHKLTIVT